MLLVGIIFGLLVAVGVIVAGIVTMVVGIMMIARAINAIIDFFHGDDVEEVEEGEASDDVIDAEEDEEEDDESEEVEVEEEVTEE